MSDLPPVGVVTLFGCTGFVGGAVAIELGSRGVEVRPVGAPRLLWPAGLSAAADAVPAVLHPDVVEALARRLDGADVVVNAAGVADPAAPASPGLYGANALLPVVMARACALAGISRFIHISSIAVQGRGTLDETAHTAAFSPYSRSRALGERLLLAEAALDQVIFRPTSVHGDGRALTRSLVRLARSPLSCVAGDGSAPSPQVLVEEVAGAVAHLVRARGPVPRIVLQPPNGMTTGLLLRLLGDREPRHLPAGAARSAVRGIGAGARFSRRAQAHVRRVDMLLFGRRQVPGWLVGQGMVADLRHDEWERLAASVQTGGSVARR